MSAERHTRRQFLKLGVAVGGTAAILTAPTGIRSLVSISPDFQHISVPSESDESLKITLSKPYEIAGYLIMNSAGGGLLAQQILFGAEPMKADKLIEVAQARSALLGISPEKQTGKFMSSHLDQLMARGIVTADPEGRFSLADHARPVVQDFFG